MQSSARTVREYLKSLPAERKRSLEAVRAAILKNLPEGYEETMQYGMPSYVVPLKTYPKGYLGKKDVPLPYISIASQKAHMAVYLMGLYADDEAREKFESEYRASGKKLDMGKSCLRFKKLDDIPLDVIGRAAALIPAERLVALYEASHK